MSFRDQFIQDSIRIRTSSPLVHNITNYVAMSFSANALLALGASPLMSSEPSEMEELAVAADSLVVNIGCLDTVQLKAGRLAAAAMDRLGKPWVLDPVGVGMSRFRLESVMKLIEDFHPAVIRGNASEIMALSGVPAAHHGVDSAEDSAAALQSASDLALRYGSVISVSGPVDYITDGVKTIGIANGSPLMPKVTAMGCTASAITAAFLAVDKDALSAAAGAMAIMGIAGEIAARESEGPGSLAVKFVDCLYRLDPADAAEALRMC